jgi:hypothetical protein
VTKAQRNAANRRKDKATAKAIRLQSITLPDNSNLIKDYNDPYNPELIERDLTNVKLGAKYYKEYAVNVLKLEKLTKKWRCK